MAFSGPGRQYQAVRPFDRYSFDQALTAQEEQSRPHLPEAHFDTSLMEHDQAQQNTEEAGRAQLAMTPGVIEGPAPAGVRGVGDSPYLEPRTFSRFGKNYTYDPTAAANAEGAVAASREQSADDVRFQALQKIPGITPAQAGRLVYGRSGVAGEDEKEPMRMALSDYIKAPSRESAAAAVRVGAQLNQFPDRFAGDAPDFSATPARGTPEYQAMLDTEGEHALQLRNKYDLTPGFAPARDRDNVVHGPNGEIGVLDLDTKKVTWTGEKGAPPRAAASKGSALARAMAGLAPGVHEVAGHRPPIAGMTDPATVQAYKAARGAAPAPDAGGGPTVPAAGKVATPEMLQHAAEDPDYKAFLIQRGYDLGGS